MTESVVAKEKQVVKNEKRQGVDNRPYGHTSYVVDRALYPQGHPYRWQVIGSLQDLDAATLADTREFHARWYGPDNATLVVAGDIDVDQTRAWIEKYFGEIPRGDAPPSAGPPPVELADSRLLVHEDNFARLPRLTMAWPAVPLFHPDSYALSVLGAVLTDGRSTPLHQVLVEEEKLAPAVSAFNGSQELAGSFSLQVGAFAGTDLDDVQAAVSEAFRRFEEEGVDEDELQRVKAGTETGFHRGLASPIGKAFQLARYAIFADDPGYVTEDLERTLAVTGEGRQAVLPHLPGRSAVRRCEFRPQGEAELALAGSQRAEVVEEPIVQGAEGELPSCAATSAPLAGRSIVPWSLRSDRLPACGPRRYGATGSTTACAFWESRTGRPPWCSSSCVSVAAFSLKSPKARAWPTCWPKRCWRERRGERRKNWSR